MTISVGMIGLDGIILAADQRMTQPAQDENQFDDYEGIRKIVDLEKHKVAYARVGDYVSRMVGDKIAIELDEGAFDFAGIRLSLEKSAISALRDEETRAAPRMRLDPNEDRSLLIVFYGDRVSELQLWRLRITPPKQSAERIVGMTIGGAIGNRARFFDHYFREALPIDTLTFLASHIVLTAGRIDPIMIHGLDVAHFDRAGFRLLDENQKKPLRERSAKLDTLISEQLLPKSR